MPELSDSHMKKLVDLWCERFTALSADEKIKYVFPFENRGDVVGVTMPHPHGQIYGYSVIPKKLQLESQSAKQYYEEKGACLYCDLLKNELAFEKRVIFRNEHFTVFLPFFTEYPYGVYIFANSHKPYITDFTEEERMSLGLTIRDRGRHVRQPVRLQVPYMMCMHNAPVNSGDYSKDFHFHIEFFPPMRSAEKQKFNASSETGAWAHCNPTCPEDTAVELRAAYEKYKARESESSAPERGAEGNGKESFTMNVLVTGGRRIIGSHTCVELLQNGVGHRGDGQLRQLLPGGAARRGADHGEDLPEL